MNKTKLWQDFVYWRQGGHSFTCQLWDLCAKADDGNLLKLHGAFPDEVEIFLEWRESPSEDEYLETLKALLKNSEQFESIQAMNRALRHHFNGA